MAEDGMTITGKAVKKQDGIGLELRCTVCGGPIVCTSAEFGMDCANGCGRKAYEEYLRECNPAAFRPE